jgi:hypothetical protein
MQYKYRFDLVSDDDLLRRLTSLLGDSRGAEGDLVAHIGEVEARRLYAREASPSMFAYCTEVLHLSEAEAYLRITAARAARKNPVILDMLGDGRLHLSGIAKLVPHLTHENAASLLPRAAHRSKRQIEELIAEMAPRPDVPTLVRRVPTKTAQVSEAPAPLLDSAGPSEPPSRREVELRPDGVGSSVTSTPVPVIEPLAPARYKVQFTATAELRDKLEQLQKLMHVGGDDLAAIIEQAVTEKLDRLKKKRFAVTDAPHAAPAGNPVAVTRYIPAWLRGAVYARDGGRCRYTNRQGRRCTERHRLDRGRDAGFPAPPAQIRACAASALGSCLRY